MKKLLFILFFSIPFVGFGQGWEKTIGGTGYELGYSVQQTTDGGYIISGLNGDVLLTKTNGNGDSLWTQTFGGTLYDEGWSVQQTTDGGYIITGWIYTGTLSTGYDVYLIKTDGNGDSLWTQTFGGTDNERSFSVQQTTDGGYVICGFTESFGNGNGDVYLIKTDGNGDSLWTEILGGTLYDGGHSVQQTYDEGYIICGGTNSFGNGSSDIYLIKTDSNGVQQWDQTFGGVNYESGTSVKQTTDGGYIICGITEVLGSGDVDVYIVKTDSNGVEQWNQTFGGVDRDRSFSIQQTTDGGYIITGSTESFGSGDFDVYLIKTDGNGDSLWTQTFGGPNVDYGYSVQQTTDGGYIICGGTESFGNGSSDIYLIKTDSNGNLTTPTWDCIGGSCVSPVTGLGLYTDSLICVSNCVVNQSWNCINNVCVNSGNGSGTYTDSLVCVSNCIQTNIIDDTNTNTPQIIKITDVLGKEIKGKKRKLLFYIYDNGTVDKKIVVE